MNDIRKQPLFTKKILLISGVIGIVSTILTFQISSITGSITLKNAVIIIGLISSLIPIIIINLRATRRKDEIDKNLSALLLMLTSSVQSGTTLIHAIEMAADRKLGALTPEVRNLKANLRLGMSIEEAFDNFVTRVDTVMAERISMLLRIILRSGSDTVQALEMIQKHVSEIQNLEKDRRSELKSYMSIIYISFVIFVVVAILINVEFFSEMKNMQDKLINTSSGQRSLEVFGRFSTLDVNKLNSLVFNMSIIEAIFGGLAAGKIGEGSFAAGAKHAVVMIAIAIAGFTFIDNTPTQNIVKPMGGMIP